MIVAANKTFDSLRSLRDRIGNGETLAEYQPALFDYGERLQTLRDAVRRDLGVPGGTPEIPL